jgi:hypothetical protein
VSFVARTLCVASQRVFISVVISAFLYRLSPETFGYTLIDFCWLFATDNVESCSWQQFHNGT